MKISMGLIAIVTIGCVLSGCSSPKRTAAGLSPAQAVNSAPNAPAMAVAQPATTYAAPTKVAFKTNKMGYRINPLRAPANQSYYFSFNQTTMRARDINALNVQAKYLLDHPNAQIVLYGNTDNRGSREYNVGLGYRRDESVKHFLLLQGVNSKQIKEVSYGKEHPLYWGSTEQAWALNRRVDLTYSNKAG